MVDRIKPHVVEPSTNEGDVFTTTGGKAQWAPPSPSSPNFLAVLTATSSSGDFVDVWAAEGDHIYVEVTP